MPHPLFQGRMRWDGTRQFLKDNAQAIAAADRTLKQREEETFTRINIGNDVWIGEGAFIRRGITIGDGAVIAARAVVTADVPPYAIVAGMPARVLRYRFLPDIIDDLLNLQWWHYGLSALEGVNFTDIEMALWRISDNIASGRAIVYQAPILSLTHDSIEVLRPDAE